MSEPLLTVNLALEYLDQDCYIVADDILEGHLQEQELGMICFLMSHSLKAELFSL